MTVEIKPGLYVVAVSGGVDSMALLDMLRRHPEVRLVVAHFDHGVREDSAEERYLVAEAARQYDLPFVYDTAQLGPDVSEDAARQARYAFLRRVQQVSGADAIITAHHQDDLLETAIMNLLRGTGYRGLVSLRSRPGLERPLLHVPKADLIAYAKDQSLTWREDSTNANLNYFRNRVRQQILPRFSPAQRQELLQHINNLHKNHHALEVELANHLHLHPSVTELDRHWFIMLPHAVAREVLAAWLRRAEVQDISRPMLERLTVAGKTAAPGSHFDIDKTHILRVDKQLLALRNRER
jgi:tRNA(Ile)-lysidine synthetase-like protein